MVAKKIRVVNPTTKKVAWILPQILEVAKKEGFIQQDADEQFTPKEPVKISDIVIKLSKDLSGVEAVKEILLYQTEKEISDFIIGETRKTVLDNATKKIKQLNK